MNNRIAKKIVKKYGAGWWVKHYKNVNGTWIYLGSGYRIPNRWKNKKTINWLLRMYSYLQ